tara:strand:+ start:3559 stop:4578 length:1020 start_codon:yes stop_codon:yes gene_type:complete
MKIKESTLRKIIREEMLGKDHLFEVNLVDRVSSAWENLSSSGDTGDTGDTGTAEDIPYSEKKFDWLEAEPSDATEEEAQEEAESKNITFWSGLPPGIKFVYASHSPEGEAQVYKCTQSGCQEYVNDMLRPGQQNRPSAWWSHYVADKSVFNERISAYKKDIEDLFTKMTNTPTSKYEPSFWEPKVDEIVGKMIPSQPPKWNLNLGDEIGLWYGPSGLTSRAMFEGATGYNNFDTGCNMTKIHKTYIKRESDGKPWHPEMMPEYCGRKGKMHIPGSKFALRSAKGLTPSFGFNSHVGFVGAIKNGEPIIFHNIKGDVWATPVSAMEKDGSMMVWVNRGGK